jgi:predicted phosphodiesterase
VTSMHEAARTESVEEEEPAPAGRRHPGKVVLGVGVGIIGALVALLALQLIPPATHNLGPARISARGEFGVGRTTLFLPPLGSISADTHVSPVGFTIEVREVDPVALTNALSTAEGRLALTGAVEDDLRATAIRLASRLLVGAFVLGAIAAAVLPRRHWWTVLCGAAGALVVVGAFVALGAATFDVRAFEEPRFTGALERAPQVIETVNQSIGGLAELGSRYTAAARRLSDLLALVADPEAGPSEDTVAILHVSDIHSNPLGLEIAARLADEFEADAVLDTGDLTSFGQPIEANVAAAIEDFPVPYLFVPGNHDSTANRNAISRFENVTLLDETVGTVDDVEILGWGDPTFTADNETTTEEGNLLREERASRVALAVEEENPDVLAVHDARLATESFGEVSLVVSGHTHERSLERDEGTLVLTVGSTGATGLGSFLVEAELPYEAEVIYFRNGRPVTLDYITLAGLGGDFEVERTTLDETDEGSRAGDRTSYDSERRRARAAEGSALLMR